jgi:hypothetical protein
MSFINSILDKARGLLQGEPLRLIGYGAGIVIYLAAKALGNIPDLPLEQALIQATAAIAVLASVIETIRRFTYSPATVAAIVQTPPTAAGPIAAAEAVGVDTSQPVTPIATEGRG